jgi:hypothetical protein
LNDRNANKIWLFLDRDEAVQLLEKLAEIIGKMPVKIDCHEDNR